MEPLEFFGANVDEIETTVGRPPRNRDICVCGHGVARHFEYREGEFSCSVAKMYCPCKLIVPVLNVDDTRVFMYDTHGRGAKHALFRGLKRLQQMNKSARILVSNECWSCNEQALIEPVPITNYGDIGEYAQARNAMLCTNCIWRMMGIDPNPTAPPPDSNAVLTSGEPEATPDLNATAASTELEEIESAASGRAQSPEPVVQVPERKAPWDD